MAEKSKPAAKRKRGRPKKTDADRAAEAAAAQAIAGAGEPPEPEPPSGNGDAPPSGMGDAPPGSVPPGQAEPERPRRRRRSRVSKTETKAIEDALRELLQMPAVPAAMLGDKWMAGHFTRQGDALANKIAVVSERNPVLRSWCLKAMEGEGTAVLLIAALMYAAPPLFHFGVIPGGEAIGVPVLRRPAPPSAQAPAPETQPSREPPEPVVYGGTPAHMAGGDTAEMPPTWTPGMEQS